jgi:hypothetical protein
VCSKGVVSKSACGCWRYLGYKDQSLSDDLETCRSSGKIAWKRWVSLEASSKGKVCVESCSRLWREIVQQRRDCSVCRKIQSR